MQPGMTRRTVRMLAVLCLLVLVLPRAAGAQAWSFQRSGPDAAQASVCPYHDPRTGEFFCFALACTPGHDLGFSLLSKSAAPAQVTGRLTVDGRPLAELSFANSGRRDIGEAVAPWDPQRDLALLQALKQGRWARLDYDYGHGTGQQTLALAGSAAAIDQVMRACPEPLRRVADPGVLMRDGMIEQCRLVRQPLSINPGMMSRPDLDGDGRADAVIDWGQAGCEYRTMNCGSAGCPFTFLHATDRGDYTVVLDTQVYGWELQSGPNGRPDLRLSAHGAYCDRVGVAGCTLLYRWTAEGRLQQIAKY